MVKGTPTSASRTSALSPLNLEFFFGLGPFPGEPEEVGGSYLAEGGCQGRMKKVHGFNIFLRFSGKFRPQNLTR